MIPWLSWPRAIAGLVAAACLLWLFLVVKSWHDDATIKLPAAREQVREANAEIKRLQDLKELSDAILEKRETDQAAVAAVGADVRDLAQRVSVCARKSDVRISVTPAGVIQAVPDEQLRDLADAVKDFAVACARERDRDAVDHNALIDWLEGLRKPPR